MQVRTAQLIRRTAKANMERCSKPMTPQEVAHGKKTIARMLLIYAVLRITVYDIEDEFEAAGLFRHQVKAEIRHIQRSIEKLFGSLHRHLTDADARVAHSYDNWQTEASIAVKEAIALESVERGVNIALACCRLLIADNDSLGRWCICEALPLHHIIRRLERLGIHDYHIDNIIERTITPMAV